MAHEVGRRPRRTITEVRKRKSDFSNRVYSLAYKHASDGKDYQHEFQPGVAMRPNADGTLTLYRPDGQPVWEEF